MVQLLLKTLTAAASKLHSMQQLSWWTQHLAAEAAVVALAEECEEVDMCVKEDADINGVTIKASRTYG